jgi:hypothetical protein
VLKTVKVTGSPAYTAILYKSLDGYNYVTTGDTITYAGGGSNQAYFTTFDVTHTKYRVIITSTSAAQKSTITLAGLIREK